MTFANFAVADALTEVIIVGGGASGALMAFHLLRGADCRRTCHVDRDVVAHRPRRCLRHGQSAHLLNVPAGSMSAHRQRAGSLLRLARAERAPAGRSASAAATRCDVRPAHDSTANTSRACSRHLPGAAIGRAGCRCRSRRMRVDRRKPRPASTVASHQRLASLRRVRGLLATGHDGCAGLAAVTSIRGRRR